MYDFTQLTDAAFVHLRGIHTRDISYCTQLTDAAFVRLRGIHTLDMSYCKQASITDAACFRWHSCPRHVTLHLVRLPT